MSFEGLSLFPYFTTGEEIFKATASDLDFSAPNNDIIFSLTGTGKLFFFFTFYKQALGFKSGYLDFLHLTELKNIYITEIYMKKQYKSSITKNHKIEKKKFYGVPL